MGKVKYISAKRGQTSIVIGVIVAHLLLVVGMYFLFFKTTIVDFDGLAVWLCSKNLIKGYVKEYIPLIIIAFFLIFFISLMRVHATGYKTSNNGGENGARFVYVLNHHNSPGSHGYWW